MHELGQFLRARREGTTPESVGLPSGVRRRTPGLRRSEVAALAGVSVEYLTRLEQGRDRHPSASVLAALAGVLALTGAERIHLHRLAKGADPGLACTGGTPPNRAVRPLVRALLDRLGPSPAVVVNHLGDALAWTDGFQRLAGPVGLLDGDPPNLVRYVFTDHRARDVYPDWERIADDRIAALKEGGLGADPHTAALTDELLVTAGAEFERRLTRVPGPAAATGVLRMRVPGLPELRLAYETLDVAADLGLRLIVHLPADDATAEALERRTPVLRLVSG